MRYLFIVPGDSVYQTDEFTSVEKDAADIGNLVVIDTETSMFYEDGGWNIPPVFSSMARMDNLL